MTISPTSSYIETSGSVYTVDSSSYKSLYDVSQISYLGPLPKFISGSLLPTYFEIIIDSVRTTISNEEALRNINLNNYFTSSGDVNNGYINYLSASQDLYNDISTTWNDIKNSLYYMKGAIKA